MPLSQGDRFKVAYLMREIEEGHTPAQMLAGVKKAEAALDTLVKKAFLGELAGKVVDAGSSLAGSALGWGLPTALVAPPFAGALAGFGLAKATDVDDTDVDEIKNRELVDEYRRHALGLVRQRDVRDYQRLRSKHPGQIFFNR